MKNKNMSNIKGKMRRREAKENLLMELAEDMMDFVMKTKTFKKMKKRLK
ncbi:MULTISPECIES: hypothetical protein [Clostridium]|uniref:Uncharacterized protein n=1 Tax=Clostridium cibarium TaxID=2762247 RepID=A0ABR8PQP8_9CLOT|nr:MULTISPECIES: hypothetical protein [Clostridium]MBD7910482.1 hypothetical protein [Clostridium cibarium]